MAVDQQTIFPDIFRTFYNLINNYVADPLTRDKQWIFSQFPDEDISEGKIKYPIIIIDPADMSWERLTMTKKWNMIQLQITVYSTSLSQADSLLTQINSRIDQQAAALKYGSCIDFVSLDSTDTGHDISGGSRVHNRSATYTMQYAFKSGIGTNTNSSTINSDMVIV